MRAVEFSQQHAEMVVFLVGEAGGVIWLPCDVSWDSPEFLHLQREFERCGVRVTIHNPTDIGGSLLGQKRIRFTRVP